ncbi:histidine kinase [Stigmatella sp. ncwal1]|uniref:Histidine kinase n=1 Tax=Stigmatella ashevillensis TaxID=2995309 RepID=A0ABT5DDD5_9BACT|nr:histidine kinase [Stigmatella ashevillena]MDC0711689.1 histidine kinase [Stigmatella ashevillena]
MGSPAAQHLTLFTRRRWLVGMALAVGVGLLQTAPEFLDDERFESIALRFLLWVLETPLQLLALSVTFTSGVKRRLSTTRALVASLLVAVAIGVLFALAFVFVFERLLGFELDEKGLLSFPLAAGFGAMVGIFIAGIWGLAFVSPHVTEQAQLRALETEQLRFEAEQLRVSSEMARLRSQLEPHFLLNTLNTIAGLVTQNPREARRLIGCLGDLLRDSLQGQNEMQTLDQEVTWLRRYAEILESRHGDALRFDWDIPPDVGGVLLPTLLLQPLVENAVQHGALCRAGGGRVAVRAMLQGAGAESKLVCTVTDNGPGLSPSEPRSGALGLRAVRRRLELRCPGSALRLQSSSEGTSAVIEVPVTAGGAA